MPIYHNQYNDPIKIYSKASAEEALAQQIGGHVAANKRPEFDPAKSRVLQLLQEEERSTPLPDRHSAMLEEPARSQEYPDFKGFVDPNLQSPSFRRLKYAGGFEANMNGDDSEAAQEHHSVTAHNPGEPIAMPPPDHSAQRMQYSASPAQFTNPSPAPKGGAVQHALDPDLAAQFAAAERSKIGYTSQPSWTEKAAQKHQNWEHSSGQDPRRPKQFGLDRAYWEQPRAEEPEGQWHEADVENLDKRYKKSFGLETPSWAGKAQQKHEKWQSATDQQYSKQFGLSQPVWADSAAEKQQNWEQQTINSGPPPERAIYQPRPHTPSWASKAQAKHESWQARTGQTHGGSDYRSSNAATPTPTHERYTYGSYGGRARSLEPPGGAGGISPGRGGVSPGRKIVGKTESFFDYRQGNWFKPEVNAPHVHKNDPYFMGGQYGGQDWNGPGVMDNKYGYDKVGGLVTEPFKHTIPRVSPKPMIERPQPVRPAPAPVPKPKPMPIPAPAPVQSSHQVSTRSENWQHEDKMSNDALRQRAIMEEELRMKQREQEQSQSYSSSQAVTKFSGQGRTDRGGKNVRTVVVHRPEPSSAVMPAWQAALGAQTKATTSGSYKDQEGHDVHYKKEVYTSSDPGREFSMLTEEEKKIKERQLQPGVVARNTTTKYYKKSAYTSSTTTGTTQSGEKITFAALPPMPSQSTPLMIQTGRSAAGISDF